MVRKEEKYKSGYCLGFKVWGGGYTVFSREVGDMTSKRNVGY